MLHLNICRSQVRERRKPTILTIMLTEIQIYRFLCSLYIPYSEYDPKKDINVYVIALTVMQLSNPSISSL